MRRTAITTVTIRGIPRPASEGLVSAWRVALGAPLLRGVALSEERGEVMELETGEALRARLLDPVLAELGEETRRLFVCSDDQERGHRE